MVASAAQATSVGKDLAAVLPDKKWWTQSHLVKLNFCIISLVLFSSSNGFDGSIMNGLLALPSWNQFMDMPSGAWLGFINAIYSLGNAVALPLCAWSANKWGRKSSVYLGIALVVVGTVMQTAASNGTTFVIARLFLGLGSAFFTAVPLLITEVAYPTQRGQAASLYNCGWYVGSIVAAWATFGTRNYATSWSWRLPSVLQVLCPLVALPGFLMCSESPRWLVSVGRVEEARQVLANIHAGGDTASPLVLYEFIDIEETLKAELAANESTSYLDMFRTKGNRHRLLISVSLGVFGQWVGNGVVSYYLAMVLQTVGITSVTHQTLISGCLQIWNFLFAVGAALSVDEAGRRALFLASGSIMLISYIIITGLSGSFAQTGNSATGVAVIPFLFIYFAGYDIALTPLLVSYPCEIWPYSLRARGVAVTFMSTLLAVFFNIFINPIALGAIGWKYYIVFIVVLIIMLITVYFYYPETRGRSLEQMAVLFDGDKAAVSTIPGEADRAYDMSAEIRRASLIQEAKGAVVSIHEKADSV